MQLQLIDENTPTIVPHTTYDQYGHNTYRGNESVNYSHLCRRNLADCKRILDTQIPLTPFSDICSVVGEMKRLVNRNIVLELPSGKYALTDCQYYQLRKLFSRTF